MHIFSTLPINQKHRNRLPTKIYLKPNFSIASVKTDLQKNNTCHKEIPSSVFSITGLEWNAYHFHPHRSSMIIAIKASRSPLPQKYLTSVGVREAAWTLPLLAPGIPLSSLMTS